MTNAFTSSFDKYACVGDTIEAEIDGFDVVARLEDDFDAGPPWERDCGHGLVSEWTRRDKAPGERILHTDGGAKRYYDFAEAVKIAKRDGWDVPPYAVGSKAERAARAVEADFKNLKAWCNDEWSYVGVVLSVSRKGITLDDHAASLWGVEMNYPGGDNSYLTEVANALLDKALDVGKTNLDALCDD